MANISSYLNTIRTAASGESVRTAIINCLNAINRDNPVTVQGKTITANGTYTAEGGIAFNPVTVQVPTGGPDSYNFQDIEITENGEYQAEEENTYYDKVTVAVPQFANDLMEERKITKNGEYEALLDGYDGYAKVVVDVSGVDTDTFTCTFVDENGTPLRTVPNIPSGGWCSDNGLRPASATGKPFQGWNPAPNDIRYNIICRPTYYEPQQAVGEITDDWATIVANKGEPYPIGAYKTLPLIITGNEVISVNPESHFEPGDGTIVAPIAAGISQPVMMKVANGEDMSTSSWVSISAGIPNFYPSIFQRAEKMDPYYWESFSWFNGYRRVQDYMITENVNKRFGWPTCAMRQYLNNEFLASIPDYIRQGLVPVIKKTGTTYIDAGGILQEDHFTETLDTVWVPSIREMTNSPTYDFGAWDGVIYSEMQALVIETSNPAMFWGNTYMTMRDSAPFRFYSDDSHVYKDKTYHGLVHATFVSYSGVRPGGIGENFGNVYYPVPIGFCL